MSSVQGWNPNLEVRSADPVPRDASNFDAGKSAGSVSYLMKHKSVDFGGAVPRTIASEVQQGQSPSSEADVPDGREVHAHTFEGLIKGPRGFRFSSGRQLRVQPQVRLWGAAYCLSS